MMMGGPFGGPIDLTDPEKAAQLGLPPLQIVRQHEIIDLHKVESGYKGTFVMKNFRPFLKKGEKDEDHVEITFEIEIATPERSLFKEQAREAQIPAKNGYIGVLPDHAPLLSELGAGVLTFSGGAAEVRMAVSGGFLEVLDNHVRVLADAAQLASEVDVPKAEADLKAAEAEAARASEEGEVALALGSAAAAQAKIDAARK